MCKWYIKKYKNEELKTPEFLLNTVPCSFLFSFFLRWLRRLTNAVKMSLSVFHLFINLADVYPTSLHSLHIGCKPNTVYLSPKI